MEQPLPQALGELTGGSEETGLRAETVVTGTARLLPAHVEEALLRIVQEALANVRKHATASRVTVTLSYLDDVAMLDVTTTGSGSTTPPRRPAPGSGSTPWPSGWPRWVGAW